MKKITPFLWFDRDAKEAMNFYVNLFNSNPAKKSESRITTIKLYPEDMEDEHMKEMKGKVLTGVFELEGETFMALDGGPLFKPNESVSFLVNCSTQEEIDHFWNAITKEGAESQCGWCKDKWGFSWQIAPDMGKWLGDNGNAGNRATQAMLGMKKIIITDLEKAYNGE